MEGGNARGRRNPRARREDLEDAVGERNLRARREDVEDIGEDGAGAAGADRKGKGKMDLVPQHIHQQYWISGNDNHKQEGSEIERDRSNIAELRGYVSPKELVTYSVPPHLMRQRRKIRQLNKGLCTHYNTIAFARRRVLLCLRRNRAKSGEAKDAEKVITDSEVDAVRLQEQIESLGGQCFPMPSIFATKPVLIK